jgi:hypothetical protein
MVAFENFLNQQRAWFFDRLNQKAAIGVMVHFSEIEANTPTLWRPV